jgi:hypothetical protein
MTRGIPKKRQLAARAAARHLAHCLRHLAQRGSRPSGGAPA